jgi:2-epi-5-epi-valiolone synthase
MMQAWGEPDASDWSYCVKTAIDDDYDVICRSSILLTADRTLANVLRSDSPILVVSTPSVDRLYGDRIRGYFATLDPGADVSFTILACSEARKSIDQVLAICEAASKAGLARQSQIVCIGGGVSLDIVGLAATLFRRGIPHVRVPTTLIGMIDAGIGVKNAVNFAGSKSLLGTFTPPEACIIDPTFLATLPERHLRCGLAEMFKIAVMCSPELFALLKTRAARLPDGDVGSPLELAKEIQLSIHWTLREIELNLFERKELFRDRYARKLDFGHTFSPYIEMASNHGLLHGEAVAVDMAICAELARRLEILDETSCAHMLDLLSRMGLPIYCAGMDTGAMHASLRSVVRHRDGNLNLALPSGIGSAVFVRDLSRVSATLLEEVWQRLARLSSRTNADPNLQRER